MDAFQWHAGLIERAGRMLAYTLEKTDSSRLEWKPSVGEESKCRSALEQAAECVRINEAFAERLSGSPNPGTDPVTVDNAAVRVWESAAALAAAVRQMTVEDLSAMHKLPFATLPGSALMEIAHANMMYHTGQINQIQLLYGDTEFRFPPDMYA